MIRFFTILYLVITSIACSTDDVTSSKEMETISDIDGHIYPTIRIGQQLWMAENLQVSRYRNGDSIAHVMSAGVWQATENGAWCVYNNQDSSGSYGNLYNWHAVNDERSIAPEGWHVPSYEELQILVDYLGGSSEAGQKIKSDMDWFEDGNGTNVSGFAALPAGYRTGSGIYEALALSARFWSSTPSDNIRAYHSRLEYNSSSVIIRHGGRQGGYSIRCLKD